MQTPITAAGRYRLRSAAISSGRGVATANARSDFLLVPRIAAAHRRRAAELVGFRGAWFPMAGKLHRSSLHWAALSVNPGTKRALSGAVLIIVSSCSGAQRPRGRRKWNGEMARG
jgi:hypothetical protein